MQTRETGLLVSLRHFQQARHPFRLYTADLIVGPNCYRAKLSGPLLDRIDLHLTVARESTALQASSQDGETTAQAAAKVAAARQRQLRRQGVANAFLDLPGLRQHCHLQDADRQWLENACERLGLSLRAAHRVIKVARTLADLDGADVIARQHVAEALQYRPSQG
ncbi:hypothetical protein PSEUDO8Z_180079 [Pseudomonas sp. 8Z]|nr:hypothetical protein PSEUDO8Z_180079 [Pseudomonas sp. 8Z]